MARTTSKSTRTRATKKDTTEEQKVVDNTEEVVVEDANKDVEESFVAEEKEGTSEEQQETTSEEQDSVKEESAEDPVEEVTEEQDTPVNTDYEVEKVKYPDAKAVADFLATPDMPIEEKLQVLTKEADMPIRNLVVALVGFAEEFAPDKPEQPADVVVGKLFNLYNMLKSVVETADQTEFVVKMDIVNLVFRKYGNPGEAFYPTMLLRYDYLWSWGDQSLKTHQVLCTVISALCDRATRAEEIKKININNQFAREGQAISQETVERLIRYYSA